MNNKLKQLIIVISSVIFLGLIMLLLPKTVTAADRAVDIDNNTKVSGSLTLGDLIGGKRYNNGGYNNIFNKEFVFCFQHHQGFVTGNYFITNKYVITKDKVEKYTRSNANQAFKSTPTETTSDKEILKYAQGLAYILSYTKGDGNREDKLAGRYHSFEDDVQVALWQYLSNSPSKAKKFFNIPNQDGVYESTREGKKVLGYNKYWIENSESGPYWSHNAYNIYRNATNIKNSENITSDWNAEIYKLRYESNPGYGQDVLLVKKVTDEPLIPNVKLTFNKKDFNNKAVSGAKITISKEDNVSEISNASLTSAKDGKIGTVTVTPEKNTGIFKIKIKETEAPTGYKGLPGTITLTVKYDTTTGAVKSISSSDTTYVPNTTSGTVTVKNRPAVKITFSKTDFSGTKLSGAKITISEKDNVSKISNTSLTSDKNGSFGTITVYPSDDTGTFKLNLTETTAPKGYKGLSGTITLTVNYNTTTGAVKSISSTNTTYVPSTTSGTVTVKNKPQIEELTLLKTDSLTKNKLSGVKFKIFLTNVEAIKGYKTSSLGTITVQATTDENGQIKLTEIVPKATEEPITARITEMEVATADGYYYNKIDPITIKMTCNKGSWSVSGEGATISNNRVSVGIKNQPLISLSGIVWEDGQTGEKVVSGINGKKDNKEKGIDGVLVELYNVDKNGQITGNRVKYTTTKDGGKYEFKDVSKTANGYKIVFKYDGINYQETKSLGSTGTDSKATEQGRNTFNNRFKTISSGKSNDETVLSYSYKDNKSTLKVDMNGTNPANENATDFQMKAQTGEKYTTTTENINCGLVKKELDLALGTDVKSAKLEINGKTTEYSYAQIMDGVLDFQNSSSTKEDVIYNLYLYSSDYNYRIDDYKTGITNNVNTDEYDYNKFNTLQELEAYVTYNIALKNQTPYYNTTVNEFVYYYDEAYTPYNIKSTDNYTVKIDETQRKITFTSKNDGFKLISPDYRVDIDLTFKVNKDANGNIILKDDATNVVEITKYSTDIGGLIDRDSAPGNGITNGKITKYEDDTDQAKGLNISIKENDSRTITGTVFDDKDKDKDGVLNNEDTVVNDVIVQLIEIKKISGQYYEYIWQETRSGSNQVKTTARNGYAGTTYTNSVEKGKGQYEFKDFIPGNYIIRFIYGDGSTYDLTDNVKKYNGQDYKSTIDANYNKAWYNTAGYTAGQSVARDNEARRLEVMAYSTTIDGTTGENWANKTKEALKATWMCAETSRINVPVDNVAETGTKYTENTNASYDYTKNGSTVSFANVNFGLALRPQTKLVLEKHITGLKITPSGTGVQAIVDAKANIEDIVKGNTVKISGITDGLAIIYSTRGNRGFWQVATDVEELMQGAGLEVEYTYVIRNDGEKDYLSTTLVEAYENQDEDVKSYNEVLTEIKDTVKLSMRNGTYSYGSESTGVRNIGTYLGQYYYNGDITGCAEVSSRIETFEESLNNDLGFDVETSGTDFTKINTESVEKTVYDTDGNKQTEKINTVINNSKATKFLTTGTVDYSRTVTLTTTLAASNGGELGANLPSYIAEVVKYSNAAGRIDMDAEPANLSYVHSNDVTKTMENSNEHDEFWAETIIITKPTGEDKLTPLQITIITISSIAVIGAGIVLIKKFVLKK